MAAQRVKEPRASGQVSVETPDPLEAVPCVEPGVETRTDSAGIQIRRPLPPKPGIYSLVSRLLKYEHCIRVNLDEQGTFFWEQIDSERSLEQIAERIGRKYGLNLEKSRKTAILFVKSLVEKRLIYLKAEPKEASSEE